MAGGGRARSRGAFWPIAVPLAAALFVVFPEASLPVRILVAAVGPGILWAAFRFLRSLFAEDARAGVRRGATRTSPALALPGLIGFATFLAAWGFDASLGLGADDRTPLYILVLALLPILALGAISGLLAAVDRRGPYRLLAIVANSAYLVLAGLVVYRFLMPVS